VSALRQTVEREFSPTVVGLPVAETMQAEESTLSLWRRYRREKDEAARAELLERHLHLVRILARRLASRIGSAVEVDDLVSAGTLGLVQALESYDMSRANSFATYASRRIHGSMLDELRRRDWVSRSVRSKARKLNHASGKIESVLGRTARPEEMAAVLQIDMSTYWSWRQSVDTTVQVSLDEGPGDGSETAPIGALLSDPRAENTLESIQQEEQVQALAGGMGLLPERERMVLVLYFYEEMNLREIAEVMNLTESRISQIRTAGMNRLRNLLAPDIAC
jgi:RNA polymerase sigma factor for flagellar operon FliA